MLKKFDEFLLELKYASSAVRLNTMCYFYRNATNCTGCPHRKGSASSDFNCDDARWDRDSSRNLESQERGCEYCLNGKPLQVGARSSTMSIIKTGDGYRVACGSNIGGIINVCPMCGRTLPNNGGRL